MLLYSLNVTEIQSIFLPKNLQTKMNNCIMNYTFVRIIYLLCYIFIRALL